MDVLAIPRTAVDTSLRVLRLPLDTTLAVFDRQGGRSSAMTLVLDHTDATLRGFAGRVLHDERLREDGRARSIAVDERRRALELRTEADSRREEADQELRGDLERAESRRAEARERAGQQQAQVEQAQQQTHRQVIEQTAQRKTANPDATSAHRREDRHACEEGTPGTTR